jgi:hypothetical protein
MDGGKTEIEANSIEGHESLIVILSLQKKPERAD